MLILKDDSPILGGKIGAFNIIVQNTAVRMMRVARMSKAVKRMMRRWRGRWWRGWSSSASPWTASGRAGWVWCSAYHLR